MGILGIEDTITRENEYFKMSHKKKEAAHTRKKMPKKDNATLKSRFECRAAGDVW